MGIDSLNSQCAENIGRGRGREVGNIEVEIGEPCFVFMLIVGAIVGANFIGDMLLSIVSGRNWDLLIELERGSSVKHCQIPIVPFYYFHLGGIY